MSVIELIEKTKQLGITLYVKNNKLNFVAEAGAFPDELKQKVKDNRDDILSYLIAIEQRSGIGTIVPVLRQELMPLSYSQQRLWFVDLFGRANTAFYNMPSTLQVNGDFDVNVAERAFLTIIQRHEILRTVYEQSDLSPMQRIKSDVEWKIARHDLTQYKGDELEIEIKWAVTQDAIAPFDLSKDIMLRVTWLNTYKDAKQGILLFNMHHIASDGWSITVLIQEFLTLYKAYFVGLPNPLPELSIQYADYAHWQREFLSGEALDEELNYWLHQLDGAPKVHSLPMSKKRPIAMQHAGGMVSLTQSADVAQKVIKLAKSRGVTPFMVMHAALAILINKHGNCEDIVIGTPVANRLQRELDPLIGFFLNNLPLRCQVNQRQSFLDFLEKIKKVNLDAMAHQSLPFDTIVDKLKVERTTQYAPLFQILLNMNTNKEPAIQLPGVKLQPTDTRIATAKFDLEVCLSVSENGIEAEWIYDVALFKKQKIEAYAHHFSNLIESIVATPEACLYELQILSSAEQNYLLHELNDSSVALPDSQLIQDLVAKQVKKNPSATALQFGDLAITYLQLHQRTNQLARLLRDKGVQTGTMVGIAMHRSIDVVVSLLATLKSGAAYVPLDPSYPDSRLEHMIADSGLAIILTQSALHSQFYRPGVQTIAVDDLHESLSQYDCEEIQIPDLTQSNLAYVIYTSGSTGKPKGVMIEHKAAVNFIHGMASALPQKDNPAPWLLLTTISFDISLFEWLGCLTIGGTCVIVSKETSDDPIALARFINQKPFSVIQTTPSRWIQLIEAGLKPAYSFNALTGGEPLSVELLKKFKQLKIEPLNCYGPTEATVWSLTNHVTSKLANNNKLSLGHGLANYQHFVLNDHHQLLPQDSIGELYIGGNSLARGYLNNEKLTSERFIDVDLGDGHPRRLYRTGDLARVTEGGFIDYLGRVDDQVKIRGHRIELGEIEQQLLVLPDVKSCVVVAKDFGTGGLQLVGYLATTKTIEVPIEDLIGQLKLGLARVLPEHMIPSSFVLIDEWPLTPSGKIDKNALPEPTVFGSGEEFVAPRDQLEKDLVDIWSELLNVPEGAISTLDNFFSLGGHSLLTVRLVSALRERLKYEISVVQIFESPTIISMAQFIRVNAPEVTANLTRTSITEIDRNQPIPLSFAQQRLWFIDQLEGGSSALYNMPVYFKIHGQFNLEVANLALSHMVKRHEILRTVYRYDNEQAVQIITDDVESKVTVLDLSSIDEADQEAEVIRLATLDEQQPFNIERDVMLRITWLKLNSAQGVLLFNVHHIASDAWSMSILVKEFATLYQTLIAGEEVALPPMALQYADFAGWQRNYLTGEVLQQHLDYWAKQLAEAPVVHSLPLDYPRPKTNTFNGAYVFCEVDRELASRFNEVAKAFQCTNFMVLHALLTLVIARNSGNDDVLLGTLVANRTDKATEAMMGFFVNTLVLRNNIQNIESFSALLEQTRSVNIAAQSHQDIPFEQLVEHLNVERSPQHNPLFQIVLSMNTNNAEYFSIEGLQFERFYTDYVMAKFDIQLDAVVREDGISLQWAYNTGLFKEATIQRLSDHLLEIMKQVLPDTACRLSDVIMLSEREMQYLVHDLNSTAVAYPKDECMHELFEAQVRKQPQATALVFEGQCLSYEALNARANLVARYLRAEHGVGPDTLVGLCIARSPQMVVGLLGILKAGGAYLPLDPDYPTARLNYMVEDAGLKVVLTDARGVARSDVILPGAVDLHDSVFDGYECSDVTRAETRMTPKHLAYVIYTSGSTGKPKGVMVEHDAVFNRIEWMHREYDLTPADKVLQKTPFTFDVSVWEFLWTLGYGATLVLARPDGHRDPNYLQQLIAGAGVTLMHFVPSMLRAYIDATNCTFASCVRAVFCSGEALGADEVLHVHRSAPHVALHNLYGPTEAAIDVTYYDTSRMRDALHVPIGAAIANIQLMVMDKNLWPVPYGTVGELYIGGVGLARGYLNRPELTAERFIVNPYYDAAVPASSARLYRTGDLVRYLLDGELDYLGRIDDQVKLRGFRIELGEIESALAACEGIHRAVVLVKGEGEQKQLVGYLEADVAEEGKAQQETAIRSLLLQQLPDYMVPTVFVWVDSWPVSVNGKLDRKALPEPTESHFTDNYEVPKTYTEERLTRVWATLLGLKAVEISANASFFALGGHSLKAVRLVSAVRDVFNRELPLRAVFDLPVLREQARAIDRLYAGADRPAVVAQARPADGRLPVSFAQQRLWLLDQIDGGSSHYHMPVVLALTGELNVAVAQQALAQIVNRHEVLRTIFVKDESGKPYQVVQSDAAFVLQQEDVSGLTGAVQQSAADALVGAMLAQPFDLSRDLMLRVLLIKRSATQHLLVANMHHIASDGWSMGVLTREFVELYRAGVAGTAATLAGLPVQYSDYASWQRDYLQGEVLERQVDYWREQLSGVPVLHSLPLDRVRPKLQSFVGGTVETVLDSSLTQHFKALCQEEGATLFMGLHAAFSALLARYSNERDIVVGSPVANREQAEVAGLIGFFVNTLVLRSQVGADASLQDLIRQSRETCLGAYAHQQVPFEKLVEVLQVERSLSHSPLFQVMLVLQNNEDATLTLPGLTLSAAGDSGEVAKFDLTLNVSEAADGLTLRWNYSSDIFERAGIERLAGHFNRLVEEALAAPSKSVHALPLLDTQEIAQFDSWNDTAAAYPQDSCIHQLFAQQVSRTPEAVAVVCGDEALSYAELDVRANQLAHYLRAVHRVGAESRVGICQVRGIALVVSVLAVLKAGGAYVPLDVTYPQERLAYIIADAELVAVLCDDAGQVALAGVAVSLVFVGSCDVQHLPVTVPVSQSKSTDAAYVIYTSGSTGQPKGVLVEHIGVLNYLTDIRRRYFSVLTDAVVSTPLSFDATVTSLFGPWLVGGRSVLQVGNDIEGLAVMLAGSQQAMVWKLTPAHLDGLMHVLAGKSILAHHFVVGGDQLYTATAEHWLQEYFPKGSLSNEYGPTETVVGCSVRLVTPQNLDRKRAAVPIGRAMPNVQLFVLSSQLQRVPVGVAGELYIGGAGVARGYLNRPELTAERFITNPFGAGRLYRTGDVVRYRPDGQLDYLGRNDFQLKIRGYRIEAGEIEAALQACGAEVALVTAHRDSVGHQVLVGYYQGDVDVEDLRTRLSARVPVHLVPTHLVQVEQFVLTANGKVDRKALPAVDLSLQQALYEAPVSDIEQQLAGIWQQLLQVERLGRQDNFFRLGGHSLLATRLASQIRQQLGVVVTLRELFEYSDLAAQAQLIAQTEAGADRPAVVAQARPADGRLPVSFAQQRLWLLDQIDGGSSHYHMPVVLALTGELNVAVAQQALAQIVNRHEVLRTIFVKDESGKPYQVVQSDAAFVLQQEDVSGLTGAVQQSAADALVGAMLAQPFDLSRDLMLRVLLIKRSATQHLLVANMHHIASDGWSMGVLTREFVELYRAGVAGTAATLAGLPVQYSDYASWQRDYLQGEVLERQVDYWREQLSGVPVLHSLPLDRVRPKLQSFVGGTVETVLDSSLTQHFKALCQEEGATLFMGLHAAFSALLARYSNERDIVVGSPVANREQAEVAGLIGFFVNTLVLRSQVGADASLQDLIRQSRETCLGAYAHQQVPFEKLVEVLQVERSLSHSPLFQVMLVLQNNEDATLTLPGLTLSAAGDSGEVAKFDLTLNVSEAADGLTLRWNYSSDIFERAGIERLAGHFNRLVEEALAAPSKSVHALPLLDTQEIAQFDSWNDTAAAYPQDSCIHQLFAQQVSRTPEAVAVVCGDEALSYAELDVRANQLAHYLRAVHRVGAESRVGICQVRGIALVVSVLAVLKAGGAYVPLDVTYPQERLAYIIADAELVAVLCDDAGQVALAGVAVSLVFVGSCDVQHLPVTVPVSQSKSTDAAYVIYTSGSTGQPKGVLVEHIGVLNYLTDIRRRYFSVLTDAVVSTPLSFDATVTSLFGPWLVGGRSVLQVGNDIEGLAVMLAGSQQAMVWKLTPAHLDGLMHVLAGKSILAHHFVVGGDQLYTATAEHWLQEYFPKGSLSNEYGPTETVVGCSVRLVTPQNLDRKRAAVPIGRAMPNVQLFVLSSQLQRVPVGVAGELYIGGAGVARGYLNRPALTAERFITNPFGAGRLYRTGDVVRYRPDGQLDYLGRNDFQLKIRGYRIEAGEIEAALQACGAEVALVTAHRDSVGHQVLVGYYQGDVDVEDLRTRLSARVPAHLVPTHLVQVEQFVLTANGKVDRKALPAVDLSLQQALYEAPVSDIEQQLAGIWQELLGGSVVSRHANFFERGGHSLIVLQLVTQVNNSFGVELSVRDVFKSPVLTGMAQLIARNEVATVANWQPLTELNNVVGSEHHLFVVPGAGGISVTMLHLAIAFEESVQLTLLDNRGLHNELMPYQSLQQQVDEFVNAVESNQPEGKIVLVGHSFGGTVIFEMGLNLERRGREVQLIMLDSVLSPHEPMLIDSQEKNLIQLINSWDLSFDDNLPLDAEFGTIYELVRQSLVRSQLISEEKSDATLQKYLHVFSQQIQWMQQYQPETTFKGQVSLIHAAYGPYTGSGRESLLARIQSSVENIVSVTEVSGDHHTMLSKPHSKELATAILKQLNQREC
uniref:Malonyl CoA-acyl carrier protein transacylase n=1 Tax=Rheinheimera sp. BAL341 TaxID=1708203 RepID=A0A486XU80_9GAMM